MLRGVLGVPEREPEMQKRGGEGLIALIYMETDTFGEQLTSFAPFAHDESHAVRYVLLLCISVLSCDM